MQVLPVQPETAECCAEPRSSAKATPPPAMQLEAPTALPTWTTLPPARRRRLVAVLGAIVLRTRKESVDEY
jgi:hypothetical protein